MDLDLDLDPDLDFAEGVPDLDLDLLLSPSLASPDPLDSGLSDVDLSSELLFFDELAALPVETGC